MVIYRVNGTQCSKWLEKRIKTQGRHYS